MAEDAGEESALFKASSGIDRQHVRNSRLPDLLVHMSPTPVVLTLCVCVCMRLCDLGGRQSEQL